MINAMKNIAGFVLKAGGIPLLLYLFGSPEHRAETGFVPVLGYLLIVFGLSGMFLAELQLLRFGSGVNHFNAKAYRLAEVGFYARNRHPFSWFFIIYNLGIFLVMTPFNLHYAGIWLGTTVLILLHLILIQEKQLSGVLGEQYRNYQERVPLWFWRIRLEDSERVKFLPMLMWVIGRTVFRFWYRIRVTGQENIPRTKPFIIVSNHESYLDPFLFGIYVPYEIQFVTTADIFTSPLIRLILKGIGTFPMRRHRQDLKSIRTMLRMINSGQTVCIFPEGGRSFTGAPLPIVNETLKLIQKCEVPILPIHTQGAYEIWPRWAPNRRRGRFTAEIKPVIEPAAQADLEKLRTLIQSAIFQEKKSYPPVKSRQIVRGLDKFLWACSHCKARNSIQVITGSAIQCNQCGSRWEMRPDYSLNRQGSNEYSTLIDWMDDIESSIHEHPLASHTLRLDRSELPYLETPIESYQTDDGIEITDDLKLALTNKRFILRQNDLEIENWALELITVLTVDFSHGFSMGFSGIRHRFILPQQELPSKWDSYYKVLRTKLDSESTI